MLATATSSGKRRRPLVIGHRGFAARFADNSLAGIEAALGMGADGVEIDVRPCADGTWMCHHDRSRGGRPIARWPVAALRRERVPTLGEIVAVVPRTRWLFVEIKPLPEPELSAHVAALAAALRRRSATTRVISSSLAILAAVGEQAPHTALSWVIDRVPANVPDGIDLSPHHTLVETLVARGRALHPWTVNRAARMRALATLGVASITTNRPDLALEVLVG